ncbi:transcriptional regulator, LysR family [Shewanella halifaxensis HAW-EB4]|uniref:Transcriptional regulator, LysR family n=1 Tax=Shewanella halifaxensis (strain HAW-EB4) TaxID=458817 RepID=B0TNI8_SHEHH|nr:LysR family transcriptional regulator [Shewanella halifaxensis]ABZ77502.1 transcriptional regulator, LysR family [Shewanella halifaxensis HAW-EB4]
MKLRSLKYFQSVYELGSITAAAKACFVSQPSITAAISQLEQLLNIELFIRHAGGVRPTSAADKLYPLARSMSDNEQSILHLFSDGPAPIPLKLGLMRSLGAERMSSLLNDLSKRIDNLELTLVDPDEACDARVVLSQSVNSGEEFLPIWQDRYQLAIPKSWSLATKPVITLSDLDGIAFINRTPCDALEKLKQAMAAKGVQFQNRANIRTVEYAWPLVNAGVGVALLPDWEEIRHSDGLVLRPFEGIELIKKIGLAYTSGRQSESLITAIISVCKACAT